MVIGSEKLLLTLTIPAANVDSTITEKDTTIIDISIAKSWNRATTKKVLEKIADKIGHKPEYVISGNGFTVCKTIEDTGYTHHLDMNHTLGVSLERVYKKEADFQEFSNKVQLARLKYNMQDIAYVQPPSQRSITRFMNMSKWTDWINRMQYLYHTLQNDIKSVYIFIPQNASLVGELTEAIDYITKIEKDIRNNGWSHGTVNRCRQLVTADLVSGNERQSRVGLLILRYIERELIFINEGESQNTGSNSVESTFRVTKDKISDNKLSGVTPMILMMPLRLNLTDKDRRVNFDFRERLEESRYCHIKE